MDQPINANPTMPLPDRILYAVAEHYGVPAPVLLGRDRYQSISRARMVAMSLIYRIAGLSQNEVGMLFGRDHTTVLNAVRRINTLRRNESQLAADLRKFEAAFLPHGRKLPGRWSACVEADGKSVDNVASGARELTAAGEEVVRELSNDNIHTDAPDSNPQDPHRAPSGHPETSVAASADPLRACA